MRILLRLFPILCLVLLLQNCTNRNPRVLVFSKMAGERHESVAAGKDALLLFGSEQNIRIDTTSDANDFTEENLKNYATVVFLNTSGDVLNLQQQNAFKRFIQAGGGFVGIHAAAETEQEWWWYGKLVGATSKHHSAAQHVSIRKKDTSPISLALTEQIEWTDELYSVEKSSSAINVVFTVEGTTITDSFDLDQPGVWYREFDGGRSYYIGLGHASDHYTEPFFREVLQHGMEYAIGEGKLDYSKVKEEVLPEETRFTKNVLGYYFDEPTEMTILPDGRIIFLERKGTVKMYDPKSDSIELINTFKVNTVFEDGMIGLTKDPNFEENHWLYIFYSHPTRSANVLSRFTFENHHINLESEVEILAVEVQRESCCHTGGSLAFDSNGNLFISTGDNTNPFQSNGYGPADERPGHAPFDAQKSSANTNDLRGKIMRIHPESDGTYTIPEGNLFPVGTKNTRPEIYVMGNRNPYRISVDKKTNYLYWGEVGPDAGNDSEARGPRGYDEVNRARTPGNFGWPLFVGNNYAYAKYDFTAGVAGIWNDPATPINTSPNNTGLQMLPPAQPALIWYPYDVSPDFPLMKTGGRNAMAGPVYHAELYSTPSAVALPNYLNNKLIIYDWMRDWVRLVSFDEQENIVDIEPFLDNLTFNNIMDMEVGPDGSLYILEYGEKWYGKNLDARLSRIEFNSGNIRPIAALTTNTTRGANPLKVLFDTSGSGDPDGNQVTYKLDVGPETLTNSSGGFEYTFENPGIYHVTLTVSDPQGLEVTAEETIVVGNEPPSVAIELGGNPEFFLEDSEAQYTISVTDREDGSLAGGSINHENVKVTFNYLRFSPQTETNPAGHQKAELSGSVLLAESDCKACHTRTEKSAGPSYQQIAERYSKDPKAIEVLADKIIRGGAGIWGETAMSAHPQLSIEQAQAMVSYILSMDSGGDKNKLATNGTLKFKQHTRDQNLPPRGVYLLTAMYEDGGMGNIPPFSSEDRALLRAPFLDGSYLDSLSGVKTEEVRRVVHIHDIKDQGFVNYVPVDLTNVRSLHFWIDTDEDSQGGIIELMLDDSKTAEIDLKDARIVAADEASSLVVVSVQINPLQGKHHFSLRFKNEKAGSKKLFSMRGIELKSK